MYLSIEILNWFPHSGSSLTSVDKWKRPHELWLHADQILTNHNGRLHLVDAINSLKKAVDFRSKDLDDIYNLREISAAFKKKNKYERLVELSIIKPLMSKKLLEIRNKIEHQDEKPPSYQVCKELSEFVWYFLKSTDYLCISTPDDYQLNFADVPYSTYGLGVEPLFNEKWKIKISGCIQPQFFSEKTKPDFFKIKIESLKTFYEFVSTSEHYSETELRKDNDDKNDTDILVNALIDDEIVRLHLVYQYFTISHI